MNVVMPLQRADWRARQTCDQRPLGHLEAPGGTSEVLRKSAGVLRRGNSRPGPGLVHIPLGAERFAAGSSGTSPRSQCDPGETGPGEEEP